MARRPYPEISQDIATFIEAAGPVLDPELQAEHDFRIRLARAHLVSARPRVFYHWRLEGYGIHWLDFQFLRVFRDLAQLGYPVACFITDGITPLPHQGLLKESEGNDARKRVEEMVDSVLAEYAPDTFLFWLSEIRKDDGKLKAFALDDGGYDSDARDELLNLSPFADAAVELNSEWDLWLRWIAWSCSSEGGGIVFCRRSSAVYDFLDLDMYGNLQVAIVRTREFMLSGRHGKNELPGAGLYLDPPEHPTIRKWVESESDSQTLSEFLNHLCGKGGGETKTISQSQECEELRRSILEELERLNNIWFGLNSKNSVERSSGAQTIGAEAGFAGQSREHTLQPAHNNAVLKSHPVIRALRDQIFISYSHDDRHPWLEDLQKHLAPFVRSENIKVWVDTQIESGATWLEEIDKALLTTKLAVLLVTPNYLFSSFVFEHELPALLREAKKGGLRILWVPVSASSYDCTPLLDYQSAWDPKNPLDKLSAPERNEAFVTICHKITDALRH